nr:phytoene desaturase family protein [Mycobacterium sp.]
MRTVKGPTGHVVVVGAGLSGLTAALHLAGRGREVTVVERENWPGGRAGRADIGGYQLDTGPTVLTMPDIIDEAFAAVGESLSDRLDLIEVEPAYRAQFADGSSIDVHSDADLMANAIAQFAGAEEADGYRKLRDWLTRLYHTEFNGFIAENFDSPLSLLTPQLARLTALGGFRKWDTMVNRYISDPRLRRVFTFQSLYAGVSPRKALAVYAVIAYMDTISGVYFPRGGMRALPDALAAAATDAGVRFVYGATATGLERSGDRVKAVLTDNEQRIACDAVILTTELPTTYSLLDRAPRRPGRLRPAPSAVVAHIGRRQSPAANQALAHHNIIFGGEWDQTFTDIIRDGRLMRDPSLLVTCPSASDPSLAPRDHDLFYVLAPAPNLERGVVDWSRIGESYTEQLIDIVGARLIPGFRDGAEVLHVVNPEDWAAQGMIAGTPFSLAHTFAQTGPFRPANTVRGVDNAVLAGSSTVPGVGVPTAMISGRLAADRITGAPAGSARTVIAKAGQS